MRPVQIDRFRQVYQNTANSVISMRDVHFVLVNSMAMERDSCHLCRAAEAEIDQIAKRLKCAQNSTDCRNGTRPVSGRFSRPILLQHFPTYRESDAGCEQRDTDVVDETYRERWEVLSREATDWLAQQLQRPRIVFSGHSHNFCKSKTRWSVDEYTISSYSWRNKNNPRFLLVRFFVVVKNLGYIFVFFFKAEFTAEQHAVAVCDMPVQSTVMSTYLYGILLAATLILIWEFVKHRHIEYRRYVQLANVKIR